MKPSTILMIEDDPAVAQSLQEGLGRAGFEVIWKASGAEGVAAALPAAQAGAVHLILLDVRLPDGSGFDFCRQLRQKGLHVPIIILTAQHEALDKVLGLEMGADDYVTKPFDLRELISRIRAQLRRAYGEFSSAEANQIAAGDLVLDLTSGQVFREGVALSLTPIEFRLLAYLARHRGQVLSRAQIVEAVWGFSTDLSSEQAVNVHIRRLREKVEVDSSRPALILTVPGLGYKLAQEITKS
jgi:DNA-binding response OmpR family regulator